MRDISDLIQALHVAETAAAWSMFDSDLLSVSTMFESDPVSHDSPARHGRYD